MCYIPGAFDSEELKQVNHTQSSLINENAFRLLSKSAFEVFFKVLFYDLYSLSCNKNQ